MNASRKGQLVVISGPSGVGKSTILAAVLDRTDTRFSVSATTRHPREGEVDGIDYYFVTTEEFKRAIETDKVLEWAEYGGHLYGTMRDEVVPILDQGVNVILDIENEGAKQVRAAYPDALLVFISPPSLDELARRLHGRGDTSPGDVQRRLSVAASQIEEAPHVYDAIVENDQLDETIARVLDILNGQDRTASNL
ncbi:MAG: guanylate kinase [Actinomycetia bacterium]|nr:guanylate kinase [Actinomycetes bacterium]